MRRSVKYGLALLVIVWLLVAIPSGLLPTVVDVSVSGGSVDIVYHPSAVDKIMRGFVNGSPSTSAGDSEPPADTPTSADAASTPTPKPNEATRAEALIHERINDVRNEHGRTVLKRHDKLDAVAQYHSKDMAKKDYFAHSSPSGESRENRYREFGIGCSGGENIFKLSGAFGAYPEEVAREAVESWMGSAGHRKNILRPQYRYEGVGVVFDGDAVYVTQNFC